MAAKTAAGYVNSMCIITEKIEEKEAMRPKTGDQWGKRQYEVQLGQTWSSM